VQIAELKIFDYVPSQYAGAADINVPVEFIIYIVYEVRGEPLSLIKLQEIVTVPELNEVIGVEGTRGFSAARTVITLVYELIPYAFLAATLN